MESLIKYAKGSTWLEGIMRKDIKDIIIYGLLSIFVVICINLSVIVWDLRKEVGYIEEYLEYLVKNINGEEGEELKTMFDEIDI